MGVNERKRAFHSALFGAGFGLLVCLIVVGAFEKIAIYSQPIFYSALASIVLSCVIASLLLFVATPLAIKWVANALSQVEFSIASLTLGQLFWLIFIPAPIVLYLLSCGLDFVRGHRLIELETMSALQNLIILFSPVILLTATSVFWKAANNIGRTKWSSLAKCIVVIVNLIGAIPFALVFLLILVGLHS